MGWMVVVGETKVDAGLRLIYTPSPSRPRNSPWAVNRCSHTHVRTVPSLGPAPDLRILLKNSVILTCLTLGLTWRLVR